MNIAVDARMIKPGSMHGIARYVFHLLEELRATGIAHTLFVLINTKSPLLDLTWPSHIKLVLIGSPWISFREQWELPRVLKKLKIDLFHAPSFVAPILCPCDMVMTIHDLNHIVLPQFYTFFHQFYYQIFVRSCIRRSRFILTVSDFSKEEIVRNLKLKSEKIFVTYNGVSKNYRPVRDQLYLDFVRESYGLPEDFLLCVSNNKPHKNVLQLVRAFCHSNIKTPLVLACPVDIKILKLADHYGKKHLIYFSRFIEEEHLPAVYSMTRLFVYPSTYEGFGLPPLEALACGAKVVVARSSSLPEVVGRFGSFTNPFDYRDMAAILERSLEQAVSENPKTLPAEVSSHIAKFSWREMAKVTLETYEKVLQRNFLPDKSSDKSSEKLLSSCSESKQKLQEKPI